LVVGGVAAIVVQALADELVAQIAWVGVPIAGIVGAWRSRRLDRRDFWPWRQAISMALICTIAGAYTVGLIWGAGYAPFLGTVGLLYFGLPVFLLLLGPALAWACATTFFARKAGHDVRVMRPQVDYPAQGDGPRPPGSQQRWPNWAVSLTVGLVVGVGTLIAGILGASIGLVAIALLALRDRPSRDARIGGLLVGLGGS
jgi:hypothetical protein